MENTDSTNRRIRVRQNVKKKMDDLAAKRHKTNIEKTCIDEYERAKQDLLINPREACRPEADIIELNKPGLREKYNVGSTRVLYRWKEIGGLYRCIHVVNQDSDEEVWIQNFIIRDENTYET